MTETTERRAMPDGMPPLVFLGPTAPASDVRALLPVAEIRPSVRRGDLHLARLMRYSVLVIIDGVFAAEEAVSPREVVDVLEDGAAVIGASSMGALRAADCAPAGAEGVGHVYRLYRSGAIGSEDEVTVLFNPDAPFPAATEALVNVRLAARRALRRGQIDARVAERLTDAARSLPFGLRTWRAIWAEAGLGEDERNLLGALAGQDVKRQDARLGLARVRDRMAQEPNWGRRPRRSQSVFGVLSEGRERQPDPARDPAVSEAGFMLWMLISGRANRYRGAGPSALEVMSRLGLGSMPGPAVDFGRVAWDKLGVDMAVAEGVAADLRAALERSGCLDAERFRHLAVIRAAGQAVLRGLEPDAADTRFAEAELAIEHGVTDWHHLRDRELGHTVAVVRGGRDVLARAKAFRRVSSQGPVLRE